YNSRSRLFNGNVRSPGEFIAVWAIILAYLIVMWLICLNIGLHKRDYVTAELEFESFYRKNDRLMFALSGNEYGAWADLCDINEVVKLKGGERLSVITAKEDLVDIQYNDKVLLALEDSEREDADGKRMISLIFGIIAAVWLLYVAVSILVMCSAHKLPRRLVTLFVKPSYLTRPPKS
ncbi:MAG: hypothetical protein K2N56_02470, partial [Oscillospiraceae bacterium]|nr:hypothetical protein [Oscillospiraceae bacterium]